MRVYNTYSRRKEEFRPIRPGHVGFYICGPTVYNYVHIGNARTFLSFDVIRRYLEYSGYKVEYVQNITDVDDKIIKRAKDEGRTAQEVARTYTQAFIDSMRQLGIQDPTFRPRATCEIPAMIELIECLLANDHAYEVDGDVYFAVRSFESYGRLSGRDVDELRSGARVSVDERKRDPLDFALWKAAKPGEPSWDSPWGPGRPGWHIECSAMSAKYLGNPFDIHAGGDDLIFPHHENELAQSQACNSLGFANYWLHGGMLTISKEKMSKSQGNFTLLKDVLKLVSAPALRLLMLQTHYRNPFDYEPERLTEATAALEHIQSSLRDMRWAASYLPPDNIAATASGEPPETVPTDVAQDVSSALESEPIDPVEQAKSRFRRSMDDDFNTATALAAIYELLSVGNRLAAKLRQTKDSVRLERIRATVIELLDVLGVELADVDDDGWQVDAVDAQAALALATELVGYHGSDVNTALKALLELRNLARQEKNWQQADQVRAGLLDLGLAIEDTPQGQRLVAKGD